MTILDVDQLAWDKMNGLLPAIVQDAKTLRILMVGYINKEALLQTLLSKKVTFFSRSKDRLWTKGETSGHELELIKISTDCDNDCLLIHANPQGPTCHLGKQSCFKDAPENFLAALEQLIIQRDEVRPNDSYTTDLFQSGKSRIAQKVGEEAIETVIAALTQSKQQLIEESADLIYHWLVLLRVNDVALIDVMNELEKRHTKA